MVQVQVKIEHCVELGMGHRPPKIVEVDLEPDTIYHLGRFANNKFPTKQHEPGKNAHVSLNLPAEQRFYSRRAFSIIHPRGSDVIRLAVSNASGLRVSGNGIGNQTYSKNQIVHLPLHDDIVFTVLGQPPASVQVRLKVEGEMPYIPKPRDMDSTWVGMNVGDFMYWTEVAADPSRQRQALLEVLIYLSTLLQSRWCSQGREFPSSKKLSQLAETWLLKFNPHTPTISAKQMTEAGRSATEMYDVPVGPSSAWVSIAQMLMSLGAMPPHEAEAIAKELENRGINLEEILS